MFCSGQRREKSCTGAGRRKTSSGKSLQLRYSYCGLPKGQIFRNTFPERIRKEAKTMFDKFGEFDSWEKEINRAATAQKSRRRP